MDERVFLDEASDYFRIHLDRRGFLGRLLLGSAGTALGSLLPSAPALALPANGKQSVVSFVTGTDRREMVYQALKPLEQEIREGVRGKRVIIKPNMVGNETPVCATHPESIRGALDFLKPFYKDTVLIAESTGRRYNNQSGTFRHFELYKYPPLVQEYNVKLHDLNTDPVRVEWMVGADGRPWDVRIIDTFYDPNNYIISICRLKTHNAVVVTLSAKNILLGAPVNDGIRHEKSRMHTPGRKHMNFNMFKLAQKIPPRLAILDGVEGMEGDGPTAGTGIEHGVALASTDFIAADRIGCLLMGVDFGDVGYLTYCSNAGLGQGNLSKIKIIGGDPSKHVVKYKLHERVNEMIKGWQM
ncbi:MAG: DUF362 domain-containing protein [Candidatus Latescibacterota bacterium]